MNGLWFRAAEREDSLRPQLESGACVPPLNFAVRLHV
jgi:hypothetical protein